MSSILTNNGAMVALQTMRQINRGMETVQDQISTGMKIGSAKDNSATWAISKVMESDVTGFRAIRENIALGSSTVNVARNAAETSTKLLTEIKEKIVQAQEDNVDRGKIQEDINQLRGQIETVVNSAQFNGLSLVNGYEREQVLSSLDRSATGVSPNSISVVKQDLTMRAEQFGSGAAVDADLSVSAATLGAAPSGAVATFTGAVTGAGTATLTVAGVAVDVEFAGATPLGDTRDAFLTALQGNAELADLGITFTATGGDGISAALSGESALDGIGASAFAAGATGATATAGGAIASTAETVSIANETIRNGDSFRVTIDGNDYDAVAKPGASQQDILGALAEQINASADTSARVAETVPGSGQFELLVANNTGGGLAVAVETAQGGATEGGLRALANLDVANFSDTIDGFAAMSADEQRDAIRASLEGAITDIEGLIQSSIDAASEFGSVQKRLDIQSDFVGNLIDSLRSGIGALVDADMEEASARLQALQVQQQLGIQALTIANQQPQNILALFR